MTSSGSMSSVSATKTGSSSANGDTVNHYRLQVSSLELYISPIMYVNPMGRDVQFFIKPNISSAITGTGIYNSQNDPSKYRKPQQVKIHKQIHLNQQQIKQLKKKQLRKHKHQKILKSNKQ